MSATLVSLDPTEIGTHKILFWVPLNQYSRKFLFGRTCTVPNRRKVIKLNGNSVCCKRISRIVCFDFKWCLSTCAFLASFFHSVFNDERNQYVWGMCRALNTYAYSVCGLSFLTYRVVPSHAFNLLCICVWIVILSYYFFCWKFCFCRYFSANIYFGRLSCSMRRFVVQWTRF